MLTSRPFGAGPVWLVCTIAASVAPAVPVMAQPGRLIMGQVRDTSGRPVPGANVTVMPAGHQTHTSARGHFALRGLEPGPVVVFVRAVGFRALREAVNLDADTVEVAIVMEAIPVSLPDLEVRVNGKTYRGRAAEIAQRALRGAAAPSSFVDRDELARWAPHDLADVLRRAGLRVEGKRASCPRGDKIGQAVPNVSVYLDDQLFEEALSFAVDLVPVGWLEAIEVYRGDAARPIQYSHPGSLCTVLLWTRQ